MVARTIIIIGHKNLRDCRMVQYHTALAILGRVKDMVENNAFTLTMFPTHIPASTIGQCFINIVTIATKLGR